MMSHWWPAGCLSRLRKLNEPRRCRDRGVPVGMHDFGERRRAEWGVTLDGTLRHVFVLVRGFWVSSGGGWLSRGFPRFWGGIIGCGAIDVLREGESRRAVVWICSAPNAHTKGNKST